jgi:Subtilase family
MRTRHPLRAGTAATAAIAALALALPAPAVASAARSAGPSRTELVLLRPSAARRAGMTDRAAALAGDARVAAAVAASGAAVLARTTVPSTLTVRATAAQVAALAADPLVARVVPDVLLPGPTDPVVSTSSAPGATRGATVARTAASCGTARHPQLDPEALDAIDDAGGATLGYTGKGVKVAFLADGIQTSSADFKRNVLYASGASHAGSPVITVYRDFSGDGTASVTGGGEAFLDASSIAAQGNATYDLSRYVSGAHPLPAGCDVRIVGAAPGATVYALKIFGQDNATTLSGFVQAINYAVAQGVSVINESFGLNGFPDTATDIVRAADEAAVAAGVTVVVSSGDAGITSTIGSPATDPAVLAVGATTTFRAYQQDTFGGINLPGEHDRYLDGNISSFSSGGFAQDGKTVNLVAPGDLNWALCSTSPRYEECSREAIQLSGGTSESSPLTAGAAADVIEAYRASHHGASPTPALVMQLLTSSARDLYAPAEQQGAGLLDVGAAVRLALSSPGTSRAPRPGGLLVDTTQADLIGAVGAQAAADVTLTNTGTAPMQVTASTRALEPFHVVHGAVRLDPSLRTRQPKFPVWSGATEVYQTALLDVGRHVARLQLQAAYLFTGQSSLLHVALFSPSGQLAGYSNPQGPGDYADVEVAQPAAGRWTAAFFTVWDGVGGSTGTRGRVPFSATELRFVTLGAVTPASVELAPDASATVHYRDTLRAPAGDAAAAIVLHATSRGTVQRTTVPVTLRTLVATTAAGGHFAGALTGGNGRGGAPGQTNTYAFTVPPGERDLDVGVAMSSNRAAGDVPGVQLVGMLEDPDGAVVAYDTNFTVSGTTEVATRYLDLYRTTPVAGTWLLVLEWVQPMSGAVTSIPFTGSIEYDQVSASSTLPDAASSMVSTSGASFSIHVHNAGVAPMLLSPDARLTTTTTITLQDVHGYGTTQALPGAYNQYYVPTETSSLGIAETSTVPATFDASFDPGDPDVSPRTADPYVTASWAPLSSSVTYAPPGGVSAGLWNVSQDGVGPYPASGEPHGTETTTATATTLAFDPTVTSSVPDSVAALTNGGTLLPDVVAPGHNATIPITITPTAAPGTIETGTLFVTAFTPGSLLLQTFAETSVFTSDLAAFPYTYTVSS